MLTLANPRTALIAGLLSALPLLLGGCEHIPDVFPCQGKHCGSGGSTGGNGGDPDVCGGLAGLACNDDEFCKYAPSDQCGAADQTGVCTPLPEACIELYAPVCGCNGETYGNACFADAAGVSILHEGACDTASVTCGGIAALPCEDGEFCNYEPAAGGQGCDGSIADAAGVCQPIPEACTLELQPVCGCDRKSYGNLCGAHAAGVSQLHAGACTEVDCKALGGRAVAGIGPAPSCDAGEKEYTWIVYENGAIPIEGMICCIPE